MSHLHGILGEIMTLANYDQVSVKGNLMLIAGVNNDTKMYLVERRVGDDVARYICAMRDGDYDSVETITNYYNIDFNRPCYMCMMFGIKKYYNFDSDIVICQRCWEVYRDGYNYRTQKMPHAIPDCVDQSKMMIPIKVSAIGDDTMLYIVREFKQGSIEPYERIVYYTTKFPSIEYKGSQTYGGNFSHKVMSKYGSRVIAQRCLLFSAVLEDNNVISDCITIIWRTFADLVVHEIIAMF